VNFSLTEHKLQTRGKRELYVLLVVTNKLYLPGIVVNSHVACIFVLCYILGYIVLPINGETFENNQPGLGFIQRCLLSIVALAQAGDVCSQQP